jgi:hypothetical protein
MTFLQCRKYWLILILVYCIFPSHLNAQSITPQTFNNGGGSSSFLEWSLTESVSVASFIVPGFSLNTGVLQPNTNVVTSINEYGPAVFGSQITIGPNPTLSLLHFKARFTELGRLSIQLMDAKSAIVLTQDIGTIFSSYEKNISLEDYPSGVFYLKVYFKSIVGNTKTGIYKVIKL